MYELIQVSEKCYYIASPAKIGLIKLNENEVCLIDSGNDKDAGKKALKIIQQNSWTLKAIYNTHSHADHIGGNNYLQTNTGCEIYAKGVECDFTNHPILEPSFLNGAYAPKELRHKFLLASESRALPLENHKIPKGVSVIDLKGHTFDMVGFMSDDGVFYIADSLSSEETLKKYKVGYIYDVQKYLDTLEYLKTVKAKLFVPSHAPACEDIAPLVKINIDAVNEIAEKIIEICTRSSTFEQILKQIFDCYSLTMTSEQYVLVGSALRSYLAWLSDTGRIKTQFEGNMMLYSKMPDCVD